MAESIHPRQLRRDAYLADDSGVQRLLEVFYRTRWINSEHYLTRAELYEAFIHPHLILVNRDNLRHLAEAGERRGRDYPDQQNSLFSQALGTLQQRGCLEVDNDTFRLSEQAFDRLGENIVQVSTGRLNNVLDYACPHRPEIMTPYTPHRNTGQQSGRSDQSNGWVGCILIVIFVAALILFLSAMGAFSRSSELSYSRGSAPEEEKEEVSAPPVAIAEPHSQPGGEPGPAVESPAFIPLDLRQASDANGPVGAVLTLGGLFEEPLVELHSQGLAFGLGPDSAYLESESLTSERSNWLMLEIGQANVRRVYLLLNLTNSNVALPGGGSLDGQGIGQVELFFSNGESHPARLIAGVNIRDWIVDLPGGIVRRAEDDVQIEVLRNTSRSWPARIDQVTVDVPEEYRGLVLESIVVEDWSMRDFGMKDPAIVWFGGALEVEE